MNSRKGNSLREALKKDILILDGAMGTMIQRCQLTEADYHKDGFTPDDIELTGCNDVLCISRPDIIEGIHAAYLSAGAQIIETNSFNANAISLSDYDLQDKVKEINAAAVKIARQAIIRTGTEAWIAASIGPTNKSLSMTQGLDGGEGITWQQMEDAYYEQISALITAGTDLLMIETVFDGLNAKAAIAAAERAMDENSRRIPLLISVTLTECGRTLSGQSLDAFITTIAHANPIAIGLNCGFGATGMIPHIEALQHYPFAISVYPNAGLPNAMGEYDETPETMASKLNPILEKGMLNIVGGCCGTTPEHIRAIADTARRYAPRTIPVADNKLKLAGLDAMDATDFIRIGERCNVAGSRKFLRLIKEADYTSATEIARTQIDAGAQIVDVNMDDAMLDSPIEMQRFLCIIGSDPDIARVPVMIDSSNWSTICSALQCVQGRPIVNSISLKDGEKTFLAKARHIHRMGAAMVVMAFDETGQADTYERKKEVCERAYRLLTQQAGIPPQDIIFDPNVLAVATGIEAHRTYGIDFIHAISWIKNNLPHAKVSGGLSNLSFSFRGNNPVREAMHAIFLEHAIKEGMDMAIVNPSTLISPATIEPTLKQAIEDVLLNTRTDATDRLIETAEIARNSSTEKQSVPTTEKKNAQELTPTQRIESMIERGLTDGIEPLLDIAVNEFGSALAVIEGPLMTGMNRVGELFGKGRMFLPQVVKSARAMKYAVAHLTPLIDAEKGKTDAHSAGKMVIATVKGDVHDIGKNIVDIIMHCNGYEMVDLGVMVPGEDIVERAIAEKADCVGLSGLITPSLEEMCQVAKLMEHRGMKIPLMIGGAGTSALHTAVKIAPCYGGPVVYTRDAASMPTVARKFLNPDTRKEAENALRADQARLRADYSKNTPLISLSEARNRRHKFDPTLLPPKPKVPGVHTFAISRIEAREWINLRAFFAAWNIDASFASIAETDGCEHCLTQWLASIPEKSRSKATEAMQLWKSANRLLDIMCRPGHQPLTARVALLPAGSADDDIYYTCDGIEYRLPTIRQQAPENAESNCLSLSDYIMPGTKDDHTPDHIGLFAVTSGAELQKTIERCREHGNDYEALLYQSLADRLVEAATEIMHYKVRTQLWGYNNEEPNEPRRLLRHDYPGIRPAIGYSSLPDQSLIFLADKVLHYQELGITVTENGAMSPSASTTGLIFAYPLSRYFITSRIDEIQRNDYIRRRGIDSNYASRFLQNTE